MEMLFFVIAIVASVLAYTMMPKPPKQKPPSLEDFSFPTAEAGRPVPAVFGEVTVTGPNLVWYGDYEVQTETEDRVKRRFYYMGLHFCVCYGPVDELSEILVGERLAWGDGSIGWTAASTASGTISIFAGNLFGGEDREGGISGTVDVMMGEATQVANTYLTTVQGAPQPGYRGVLSLVANKVYIGANTTYVKPWAFRVRRALAGWHLDDPWYPGTARVIHATSVLTTTGSWYLTEGTDVWWSDSGGAYVIGTIPESGAFSSLEVAEILIPIFNAALGTSYTASGVFVENIIADEVQLTAISVERGRDGIAACIAAPYCALEGDTAQISGESSVGNIYDPVITCSSTTVAWDMNPAHIIYEAITNPLWGMGYPSAMIDDTSFREAADTFYNEGMGLSLMWTQQSKTEEFIREILDHCAAVLGVDPETGKFILTPLRADYDAGTLTTFDEGEIQAIDSFDRTGYGELTGEVSVVYRDKSDNKDKTVTVQNLAVIQSQSGVVSETLQFPGISRHELATRVAMRELKARSVPLARGKIKVNRTAWDLIPGGVFKLTWSNLGLTALICRVIEVDTGTLDDGAITVTWVEDVFGLPSSSYAAEQASGWTEPSFTPVAATEQAMFELPYWWLTGAIGAAETAALPAPAGYVYPLAKTPQGLSDGHQIWARESSGSPTPDYAEVYADGDWAPNALLNGAVSQSDTSIAIDGSSLDVVVIGGLLLVGSGATAEIMRITGGDLETSVTVTRGHLDTTPQDHADNTRLWLLPPRDLRDPTQYSDGETVDTKLLTITGAGVLDIGDATAASITLDARATRPIAPGNVRVNGEAWPATLEGALTVTWAHRDRVAVTSATLQSTTGMASEAGVTYNAYVYDDTDDSVLDSDVGISGTSWSPTFSHSGVVRVEIESVRDGYTSWQRQVRAFIYGDARITESGDARATEAGDTRTLEG